MLKRIGQKATIVAGAVVLAGGMVWLSQVTFSTSYAAGVLGPIMLFGMGAGIVSTALNSAILTGVSSRDSGAASSLLESMNWVGSTLALGVLTVFFGSASKNAAAHPPTSLSARQVPQYALVHGMSVAFTASLLFIACGLVITVFFFRRAPTVAIVPTLDEEAAAGAGMLPG